MSSSYSFYNVNRVTWVPTEWVFPSESWPCIAPQVICLVAVFIVFVFIFFVFVFLFVFVLCLPVAASLSANKFKSHSCFLLFLSCQAASLRIVCCRLPSTLAPTTPSCWRTRPMWAFRRTASSGKSTLISWTSSCRYCGVVFVVVCVYVCGRSHLESFFFRLCFVSTFSLSLFLFFFFSLSLFLYLFSFLLFLSLIFFISVSFILYLYFLPFARRWRVAGPTRLSNLRISKPPRPCRCWRNTATCTIVSTTTFKVRVRERVSLYVDVTLFSLLVSLIVCLFVCLLLFLFQFVCLPLQWKFGSWIICCFMSVFTYFENLAHQCSFSLNIYNIDYPQALVVWPWPASLPQRVQRKAPSLTCALWL